MDEKTIKAEQFPEPIKTALKKGDRVQLIPLKHEVKAVRVRMDEIKAK